MILFSKRIISVIARLVCSMASEDIISIDGGAMEGGGQILRMSLALSALQGIPIRVFNIRAGRRNPGLQAQHLTGLKLVAEICGAQVTGAYKGSTEIFFSPSRITCGHYRADAETAASVGLLLQVALPLAIFAEGMCTLSLQGGTNAEMAPQIDYTDKVLRPLLKKFGVLFDLDILMRGFFPQGGGSVKVTAHPTTQLKAVDLVDSGDVVEIEGEAFVAGQLPARCADEIVEGAKRTLDDSLVGSIPIKIHSRKLPRHTAVGTGSGINLVARTNNDCILGGSGLGKRNFSMADLGKKASDELLNAIDCRACVDEYAQDQIILFMALAHGVSRVRTGPISLHTETAIHVAKLLTKASFECIKDGSTGTYVLECHGIGFCSTTSSAGTSH